MHLVRKPVIRAYEWDLFTKFRDKRYSDFRNQMLKVMSHRPESYYSVTNTGRKVTVKFCRRQGILNSLLSKVQKEIDFERKVLENGEAWREFSARCEQAGKPLTWDAVRLRKKRLLDRLEAFVASSRWCYFFTITSKKGFTNKKDFLYAFENARKKHEKLFGKMHYVGVLERHPKRKNHPIHMHICVFFESGYKEWSQLWETFGKDIGHIDIERVNAAGVGGLMEYTYKAMLQTITAYLTKTEKPGASY